ncbi:threonine ammonia-lyase [Clostridia bacterium]|nr:threonine ammonia-lyase [Clostridia bacterium]
MSKTRLELKDIEIAASRLRDVLHYTPLTRSDTFSRMANAEIFLKYENLQKTGSFKIRGAYNKIFEIKDETAEVVAASAGNHAQGVAFASRALGLNSTIVMPKSTPIAKVKATEGYGANVVLSGSCYDDAFDTAMTLQRERGAAFVHPFNDLSVIAGQGTIGQEILKDLPSVDVVFIPAGGGGLLAGTAFYLKNINPRIKIVGVQAEGAPAIVNSFRERALRASQAVSTIADGIAVKTPGEAALELINQYVDEMVTVTDAEISSAILFLLERGKQMIEPAGAASLAAAIGGRVEVEGKRCACILSGGNIDVGFIHRIIEIGLAARNRKLKFKTIMPDIPGSLEKVAKIMSDAFANIVMVQYDRMSADLAPEDVILHIACEVGGKEHGQSVIEALENNGYRVFVE